MYHPGKEVKCEYSWSPLWLSPVAVSSPSPSGNHYPEVSVYLDHPCLYFLYTYLSLNNVQYYFAYLLLFTYLFYCKSFSKFFSFNLVTVRFFFYDRCCRIYPSSLLCSILTWINHSSTVECFRYIESLSTYLCRVEIILYINCWILF